MASCYEYFQQTDDYLYFWSWKHFKNISILAEISDEFHLVTASSINFSFCNRPTTNGIVKENAIWSELRTIVVYSIRSDQRITDRSFRMARDQYQIHLENIVAKLSIYGASYIPLSLRPDYNSTPYLCP